MNGTDNQEPKPLPSRPGLISPLLVAGIVSLLTILIVVAACFIYRCCCGESNGQRSKVSRHISKSVAIVVKIPSLVESITPDIETLPDEPKPRANAKKTLRRFESKSLKISECNQSDVRAKISFPTVALTAK
jgi:hypothetical protein